MKYLLLLFPFTILIGCKNAPMEENCNCNLIKGTNTIIDFTIVDTVKIVKQVMPNLTTLYINQYLNDTIYYYANNSLQIVDFKTGFLINSIDLSEINGNVQDFLLIGNDTVFVLTYEPNSIVVYSRISKTVSSIWELDSIGFQSMPFVNYRMRYSNNLLETKVVNIYEDWDKYMVAVDKFDIGNQKISSSFCQKPSSYRTLFYPLLELPSKVIADDKMLISFGTEHCVREYSQLETGYQYKGSFCAKSNFINEDIIGIEMDGNSEFQDQINFIIESPFYLKYLVDSINKVSYRIVKHSQQLKNLEGRLNERYDGPWSILVFNEANELIGEKIMDAGKFSYPGTIVCNQGLAIPFNISQSDDISYLIVTF
ncbi:MAG: hypothetical protein IPH42_03060 [Bacteroidetes bacterium]|nr:hypothetical protein [Bacteroidota bacterium]